MANSASLSKDEDEDEDENEGDFMKKVKRLVKEKLGKKKKEEKKSGIIKEKLEEIEGILKEQGLKIEEFDEDELYFLQDDLGISSVFADDCYYNSDSSLGSWNNNDEENFVVRSRKSDEKEKKKKDKKKRKRVSSFEPGFEPNKKHHKKDDGDDDGGGGNDNVDSPKPVTQLDWPCYTCGKVFNSHQALGGHRSSHNKKNNSKSSLALTLAQDPIQGGQVQIDQGSGLTDLGPGSRSGSGEVKSVIEVGESSSWSPPVQQVQTSSTSFESSPSAQTSSGQRDPVPYMIDLNVSLMDEEEGEW